MEVLWLLIGISAVFTLQGIHLWAEDRGVVMTWWKWLLILMWLGFAGGAVAFVTTSMAERETQAAMTGGIVLIPLAIVSGGLLRRLLLQYNAVMDKKALDH